MSRVHDASESSGPAVDTEDSRSSVSSSSRSSSQFNMTEMIQNINQRKVGEGRSRRAQQEDQCTVCLVDEESGRIKWIQPSGTPGDSILSNVPLYATQMLDQCSTESASLSDQAGVMAVTICCMQYC